MCMTLREYWEDLIEQKIPNFKNLLSVTFDELNKTN